jgi:hypothetical protein
MHIHQPNFYIVHSIYFPCLHVMSKAMKTSNVLVLVPIIIWQLQYTACGMTSLWRTVVLLRRVHTIHCWVWITFSNFTVTNSYLLAKNTLSEVVLIATKWNLDDHLYCINTVAALETPPFTSKMQHRGHTSARTSPEGSLYESVTLFYN